MTPARLPRTCALLVALCNVAYAASFLVVRPDDPDVGGTAASALLLAGALLALPVLLALYRSVAGHELALLGAVLDTPNAVDPRGLLSFGFAGLALLVFAPLLAARRFAALTAVLGVALV